jgi:hypothetical protein
MKVRKERNLFALEMKTELDLLNYGGHDYLLSASALPLEEQLFPPHFSILGKKREKHRDEIVDKLAERRGDRQELLVHRECDS